MVNSRLSVLDSRERGMSGGAPALGLKGTAWARKPPSQGAVVPGIGGESSLAVPAAKSPSAGSPPDVVGSSYPAGSAGLGSVISVTFAPQLRGNGAATSDSAIQPRSAKEGSALVALGHPHAPGGNLPHGLGAGNGDPGASPLLVNAQRLRHRGGRFCANAVSPSRASSLAIRSSKALEGWVTASTTSTIPRVSSMTCSEMRTEVGELSRISAASCRAPSSA